MPASPRAAIPALFLIQAALLISTAWDKSDTVDEPHYLATAVRQWSGDLTSNCESPALPKWGFGLALRVADPALFDPGSEGGRDPLWSRPPDAMRRNLMSARGATIAVTLVAGLLLWRAARGLGEVPALVTYALWCLSPNVLAYGSLATLDGWATAFVCASIWAATLLLARPGPARAALLGACLAAAASCKATALWLLPFAAVLTVVAGRRGRASPRRVAKPDLVGLGALIGGFGLTLFAVYGFRFGVVDTASLCGRPSGWAAVRFDFVPFAPWIEGLLAQWLHGRGGHLSYLHGQVSGTGWWWFYLAALAWKTTLGAQALALSRAVTWMRLGATLRELALDAVLLACPVTLVVLMSAGNAQTGIRYILPAVPFGLLWLGRAAGALMAAFGRWGALALGIAVSAAAGEAAIYHPHHLMFFNLWAGGPSGGPRYLVLGDDSGQDQRRLGQWQRETRPWRLHYTYYSGNPIRWGIAYEPPPCEPRPGYYALQAVEVHRPKRIDAGCLDWLTVEPPDARLGYSIYLYQVNRARIARLQAERATMRPFWRSGPAPSNAAGP